MKIRLNRKGYDILNKKIVTNSDFIIETAKEH